MIEIAGHKTNQVSDSWHLLFDRIVSAHLEVYALLFALASLIAIAVIH